MCTLTSMAFWLLFTTSELTLEKSVEVNTTRNMNSHAAVRNLLVVFCFTRAVRVRYFEHPSFMQITEVPVCVKCLELQHVVFFIFFAFSRLLIHWFTFIAR